MLFPAVQRAQPGAGRGEVSALRAAAKGGIAVEAVIWHGTGGVAASPPTQVVSHHLGQLESFGLAHARQHRRRRRREITATNRQTRLTVLVDLDPGISVTIIAADVPADTG